MTTQPKACRGLARRAAGGLAGVLLAMNSAMAATIDEASRLLAQAELAFPEAARRLFREEDGLPLPDAAEFARKVERFAADHPVTPPSQRGATLWDTRSMASRQCKCLAYLAGGKRKARQAAARLCAVQAARMQWTFPIAAGRGRVDRTFYAAAGSLALTGGLVRSAAEKQSVLYETATQWLRTALGQLATSGARGSRADRKAAEALAALACPKPDALKRAETDEDFFAQIDLARPDLREVARHVAVGDLDRAEAAYVQALARRFSPKRRWPDIHFDKAVDLPEADDICRNVFVLQAHMFRRCDFGKEVDWAKVVDKDIESRVWMNAHPWMWCLLNAYRQTGDDKYVEHLCRHFNSWYRQSPRPFTRSSAQWRTLECGGRAGQKWGVVLLALARHPTFQRECLFRMARSMLDHGKYLSMYAAGGGNWLQVESSGLACAGLLFPEFKLSPLFYDVAMSRLAWVNARSFLPDGFQSECSPGYHRFPLIGIAGALRLAKFLNRPVPESLMRQYEAGVAALQYIAYPDLALPMLSDVSPRRTSAVEVLQTGAEVFGRDDFRWFATGGRKGKPPAGPSHDFTHAGYCVMRDRWGPDGQVLIFDAGYFGAGHQHEDKLNFVYYAGGRELIGDPGIYSYKRDRFEPYWRGSWSHNTIVIDGLSQHRALGPAEKMPDPDRRFVLGDGFDFAVGWYKRAYSPRRSKLWSADARSRKADRTRAVRDVRHQRCIFLVKGRCAIVCDRVAGKGERQIDILFHPAPVLAGEGIRARTRPVKLAIQPDGTALTREPKHANVAVIPARGKDFQVLDLIGRDKPVRGWYALFAIAPSHDVVYRCRRPLPAHFETVIQPLPAGRHKPMRVRPVPATAKRGRTTAGLLCGRDLFLLSYDGPAEIQCGNVRFHGTALLLRRPQRAAPCAYVVDGKHLTVAGREILSTDQPKPAATIQLPKDLEWPAN